MGTALTEVKFNYDPRPMFLPFHQRTQRFACMVVHRRAGKTVACVNELVIRALYCTKENARFSYIAPTFTQAKDIAWQYLKDAVKGFVTQIRESELRVILPNGAWITLYGSDNQNRLRGIYHDGLICDEYGDCRPSLWGEILLPALLDRDGWAVFIGTPKGKNHFYRTYERAKKEEEWYSFLMPANVSGILSEKQLRAVKQQSAPEEYEQEMLCSFTAAVRGTYYSYLIQKLEIEGNIKAGVCAYNPEQKVFAAADLGFSDSTAFWFWKLRPDGIAIIDHHEADGKDLEYYFGMLDDKGYEYETIWLPHDARAKTLQTGRSTIEQFLERKYPVQITPKLSVQHGIDAVRKILPRCYIDTEKCYNGVEALRAYRRKYDEINQSYSNTPLHDFASDSADAFRYLALVAQVSGGPKTVTKKSRYDAIQQPKALTLDELFDARETSGHKFQKLRI